MSCTRSDCESVDRIKVVLSKSLVVENGSDDDDHLVSPVYKRPKDDPAISLMKLAQQARDDLMRKFVANLALYITAATSDNSRWPQLLLEDFIHLKYRHADAFHALHTQFTSHEAQPCALLTCPYAQRHFRDRSKRTATDAAEADPRVALAMDIVCRIHVFFVHSYDINRLSPQEMAEIERRRSECKESDDEEIPLSLLFEIIKRKKRALGDIISHGSDKFHFSEPEGGPIAVPAMPESPSLSDMESAERAMYDQFMSLTHADATTAQQFLKAANDDVDDAAANFFRLDGDAQRLSEPSESDDESSDEDECHTAGVECSFWKRSSDHNTRNKAYVSPRHANLKEELLEHERIRCEPQQWAQLLKESELLMDTSFMKNLRTTSGIADSFEVQHCCAVKLFTEYTPWRLVLSEAFSGQSGSCIRSLAHWGKLLWECTLFEQEAQKDRERVYLLMSSETQFSRLTLKFNMPFGATSEVCGA